MNTNFSLVSQLMHFTIGHASQDNFLLDPTGAALQHLLTIASNT